MLVKLKSDLKDAMKSGDSVKKDILRVVISEVNSLEMTPQYANKSLPDEQVYKIINKLVQSNTETLKHSNPERTVILTRENEILNSYLPKQLSQTEIQEILVGLNDLKLAKNVGQATGLAMKYLKEQGCFVDGNDVKTVVSNLIS